MRQRQNGKKLMLFGGITILVVLALSFFLTRSGGGSKPAVASTTAPLVVAQQTVPQGTIFKQGQSLATFFTVKQVPLSLVPFGGYTSVAQIASLTHGSGCGPVRAAGCEGQITATQTIFQNTPVVSGMFSTLGRYRQSAGPSFAIPYGYVGMAVSFTAANSVLGSISAGDDIDLIASWPGGHVSNGVIKGPMIGGETQYALNDIRVIAVNGPPATTTSSTAPSTSSSSSSSSAGAAAAGGSLVLMVRYQQALEIQHLKDFGWTLSCVLRSAKETDILHFKTMPVTDHWFFSKSEDPDSGNPGY